jgi:serine/threonine protein kinase
MATLNPRLADLSDDDRQVLDSWLVEFDQGWDEGLLANRLGQIPPGSSWRLPALAEMVKIDLQRQWRRGRQVSLESYLEEFPELDSPGDVSVDLIQAEYEVRRQFGAPLTLEDYVRRFPHQAGELARLIASGGSALARYSSVAAPSPSRSSSRVQRSAKTPEQLPEQFGRYRIIKRLGQGGMGSVYLAQDTHLERPVALKVPDFGNHEDPEARRRFLEEARTAATLDHPYLCPVHDAGEIEGQLYLTMAYIEGQSLAVLIGTEGWPQRQVAAMVGKLALALQEAHKQKVIHRDLKPANVMIKTTGQRREPVIVDFGLAHRDNPQEQRLTRSGQVMGTLGYMAPEQIRGDLKEIGPASDIYALGVILYELLTGRLPFSGSGLAIAGQILTQAPLPPSRHRSDLDPALEAICLKAMAKAIGDRYTSMGELAAALTGFLHSLSASPTPAAPAGSPASPSPASGERPHPAGSHSLVGQFLAQLAENKASPAPILTPEPVASPSQLSERRRLMWPTIVAAVVLGVIVLSAIVYVATDKGRIKTSADDTGAFSEVAGERPTPAQVNKPSEPQLDSEAPEDGFQSLFNGKDLTGWKTHPKQPGNWHVANGVLIGSGAALSHLYSEGGDFTDFHLRVEARFNEGGTSGVYVRCPFGPSLPADDPKWPDGFEATINNARIVRNSTGALYPGAGNAVFLAKFARVTSVPFRQWFTLDVVADGNALAVLVNGKYSAYKLAPNRLHPSGHIALQQYSPGTVIEFRKIEIKELNSSDQKDSKQIRCFQGATDRVNRVAFSPDGLAVLSGEHALEFTRRTDGGVYFSGHAYALRVREAACGRVLFTIGGGGLVVQALAFSADGRYAASSDGALWEQPILIWDLKTGQRKHRLILKDKSMKLLCTALSFSADDCRVMAALANGAVLPWDLVLNQA